MLALDEPDHRALDTAIDEIRSRFGITAIARAALLDADPSLSAWLLPGEDEGPASGG